MTRIAYSLRAIDDLSRLVDFLRSQDAQAASQTLPLIAEAVGILKGHPEIGRWAQKPDRELVISRGRTGYMALYRFDPQRDTVTILAVRHQREAGYRSD